MSLSDFNLSNIIVKVLAAIVILIVTAIIAKVVKGLASKHLVKVKALNRNGGGGSNLAESIGSIASLVIWILGLMAVLNLFQLTGVLTPLQQMLGTLLGALPNVIGAGLVLFIGIVLAKIVRSLVVTALEAANVDQRMAKLGGAANRAQDRAGIPSEYEEYDQQGAPADSEPVKISNILGQIVFAVIVLVVSIAALQMLGIKSISEPATHMLQLILDAIPRILGAAILIGIGVVIAKLVGNLLESVLGGLNTRAPLEKLGVDATKVDIPTVAARIVQIAIVLFFAIAATNMLGFPQITEVLNTVLGLGGKVVFGAVVIVIGVFFANLVSSFVGGRAKQFIQIAIVVLFSAMGLKYMGLADSIINMAFGAVVIGGAAAAALAFGLGGREAAARQLDKIQRKSNDTDLPQ